jgi:hypothetical protein
MPRIRSIKPEWPRHHKIGRCSDRARVLHASMFTQADDEGRLVADLESLRLLAWGYHPSVTTEMVADALQELVNRGSVAIYRVKGVQYAYFPSWTDHQAIDRPRPSQLPAPPKKRTVTIHDSSTNDRRTLDETSLKARRARGERSTKPRRALDGDRKEGKDRKDLPQSKNETTASDADIPVLPDTTRPGEAASAAPPASPPGHRSADVVDPESLRGVPYDDKVKILRRAEGKA